MPTSLSPSQVGPAREATAHSPVCHTSRPPPGSLHCLVLSTLLATHPQRALSSPSSRSPLLRRFLGGSSSVTEQAVPGVEGVKKSPRPVADPSSTWDPAFLSHILFFMLSLSHPRECELFPHLRLTPQPLLCRSHTKRGEFGRSWSCLSDHDGCVQDCGALAVSDHLQSDCSFSAWQTFKA